MSHYANIAIKFNNGMLMVFDEEGKQMPKYQGRIIDCLPKFVNKYPNVHVYSGGNYLLK